MSVSHKLLISIVMAVGVAAIIGHADQSPEASNKIFAGFASVVDGDTLNIRGTRIRLHGVDSPESSQYCYLDDKPWRCGQEAAMNLANKIRGKNIVCVKVGTSYDRIVAKCKLGTLDLSAWLAEYGWAVATPNFTHDYVVNAERAKQASRGIWASRFQEPWLWRKAKNKG